MPPQAEHRTNKHFVHNQGGYSMFHNSASGPEIGLPSRILAGLLPGKHRNGPSGRPPAGRRDDFGSVPVAVRPKSGPRGRFPARKHDCVTSNIPGVSPRRIWVQAVVGLVISRFSQFIFEITKPR